MRRVVIFLHGKKPTKESVKRALEPDDFLIAADGGVKYVLSFGFVPNVVIGDFDSVSKKQFVDKDIELVSFPTEKDETDSELALQYALEKKFDNIVIFGFSGSRIDHVTANMMLFAETAKKAAITIVAEKQTLYFVTESLVILGKRKDTVSLIPLRQNATGVTTEGLKWQLSNATLVFGKTRGVSNEMVAERAEIKIKSGVLLVVHARSRR